MENMEKELEERELMNENENREFYVYVHIRKDNNTVFYVGKGTKNRAHNLDRGSFHNGVRDKYGCKVVIIKDNLTESQAFRLESKMIKYYVLTLGYGAPIDGYRDFSNNYLTNFTWGGEGTSGFNAYANKTPEEMEIIGKKISEKLKGKMAGKKNPMFGKKGKDSPIYGKHHSEEHNKKISESMKGKMAGEKNPMAKKIICITTGETFDSIKEAGDHYNIAGQNISKCCNKKRKSAGKLNGVRLQWKYLEDYNNESKAV